LVLVIGNIPPEGREVTYREDMIQSSKKKFEVLDGNDAVGGAMGGGGGLGGGGGVAVSVYS